MRWNTLLGLRIVLWDSLALEFAFAKLNEVRVLEVCLLLPRVLCARKLFSKRVIDYTGRILEFLARLRIKEFKLKLERCDTILNGQVAVVR